ncbi:sialate O-acetylesterase [Alteromonas sp. ASW11-19]|uniref:Sialate O-acetylesterase n=1 Tax=Alteromonas salexigens TaxID=2982530 RepID=A0ABT2VL67_9ALTE|nr:sialate O-acetylesterase [Alteromonas salexigens]MCU7554050.1 sialate O-acetylesterase [Alteromonas salexigens]
MNTKLLTGLLLLAFTKSSIAAEYLTFFLGGQSNMDGYGYVSDLPKTLASEQNVMIFHGNGVFDNQPHGGLGKWSKLQPGHGTGFNSDGNTNNYSDRFGAELSFAATLAEQFPQQKIALIKYAVGGTGLHLDTGYSNWSPDFRKGEGQNQYDFALNTINNAYSISDIDGDGEADRLIPAGIIWMQGEADAHSSEVSANAYFTNLTRLMGLVRAAFRDDDMPVVIGRITDSELGEDDIMPYIKRVHLAQQQFVEQDICASYMSETERYPYGQDDAWHYLSEGYVEMGRDFAKSYLSLASKCNGANNKD